MVPPQDATAPHTSKTKEEEEEEEQDEPTEDFLRPAISGVPMVFPLVKQTAYFVRDCYKDYYALFLKKLSLPDCLYMLLTGTPGIGKSIFYMYFFDRYRQEHPGENIVLASFSSPIPDTQTGPQLLNCRLWNADTKVFEELKEIPKNPKVSTLHLYDGIPEVYLSHHLSIRMICFASPNEAWIDRMIKFRGYFYLAYMSSWTFSEQKDARDALDLEITDEQLRKRWDDFGGTVRYTFLTDGKALDSAVEAVASAIEEQGSVHRVYKCLRGRDESAKVRHRLFHFDINKGNFDDAVVPMKVASRSIGARIYQRLETRLDSDRNKLIRWLEGASKAGTFAGWIFEGLAHEKLLDGLTFDLKNLLTDERTTFTRNKTAGTYTKFKPGVSIEQLFEDVYRIPADSNLRSVDGYYVDGNGVLWLIQVTKNVDHKVNSLGIVQLLKDLKKLDDFVQGKIVVNLLFVIPQEVLKFPVQQFWSPSMLKQGFRTKIYFKCSAMLYNISRKQRSKDSTLKEYTPFKMFYKPRKIVRRKLNL